MSAGNRPPSASSCIATTRSRSSRSRSSTASTALAYRNPEVKALALADSASGPFVAPTRESVASRAYPLARSAYVYFAPDTPTGDRAKVDPKIREFLRYVLSREGQEDVLREGDFLPLSAQVVREQRRKLD